MAKWYILHTKSGAEKSVKKAIEEQVRKMKMSEYFEDIVVPAIEVPEVKRGKKVMQEKKLMPGYVLIKMDMNDKSWHLVKSVPKITGFLGSKTTPKPMSQREIDDIFKQIEDESETVLSSSLYNVGDSVQVVDGPFDSFTGIVEEVDGEAQKLKISVSIFGKATQIELSFLQVKKDLV